MKKLSLKLLITFLPFFFISCLYLTIDPFKVIYKYESYYEQNKPSYIVLNRDFVTFETFINNYPQYKYDSFVFGGSSSVFYKVKKWKKYIKNSSCFHFDDYGGTLYGIYIKIKYLYLNNVKITNALIVFHSAYSLEKVVNSSGRLYLKHPELSGQSKLTFQFENFKDFLSLDFFILFWQHTIMGKVTPKLSDTNLVTYDLPTNEYSWDFFESAITSDPDQYYTKEKMQTFLNIKRGAVQKYSPSVLKSEHIKMLEEIKKILAVNNTNYKIVISPDYSQLKLSKEDMNKINQIFGKENVYDFSGINNITDNYLNFYDNQSHPRPHVTDFIMQQIYKN